MRFTNVVRHHTDATATQARKTTNCMVEMGGGYGDEKEGKTRKTTDGESGAELEPLYSLFELALSRWS